MNIVFRRNNHAIWLIISLAAAAFLSACQGVEDQQPAEATDAPWLWRATTPVRAGYVTSEADLISNSKELDRRCLALRLTHGASSNDGWFNHAKVEQTIP